MKKIPDINEALVSAFAIKLLELYKRKDPNFIPLVEYIFVRAFTAAANSPENLLSNIKYTYDINNLYALAALLKKIFTERGSTTINADMDNIVQGILLRLFPEPQQLIFYLNSLLVFHFELSRKNKDYSSNIQFILELLIRSVRSIKNYQECLINYLKQLLHERKMLPVDQSTKQLQGAQRGLLLDHQLVIFCNCFEYFDVLMSEPENVASSLSKEKNVEVRSSILIEDIRCLFMLFARHQDEKAYLRGNGAFDVRIVHYFAHQDANRLFVTEPRLIARRLLESVITKIIQATPQQIHEFQQKDKRDLKDSSAKKDSQLHILITEGIQEFLNWLLGHGLDQLFGSDLLLICNWVIEEMYINKNMQMAEVRAYIAGVIFLRMINPAILKMNLDIQDPVKSKIAKEQLVSIPIIVQALANQTNKEINRERCSPGQIALITSEINRRNMVKFLDQFFAHLPAHTMTSSRNAASAAQAVVLMPANTLVNSEVGAPRPVVLTHSQAGDRRLSVPRMGSGPLIGNIEISPRAQAIRQQFPRSLSVSADNRPLTFINKSTDGVSWRRSSADPYKSQRQQTLSAMRRSTTVDKIAVVSAADPERADVPIAEDNIGAESTQASLGVRSATSELAIVAPEPSNVAIETSNNNDRNNPVYVQQQASERSELVIVASDASPIIIEPIRSGSSDAVNVQRLAEKDPATNNAAASSSALLPVKIIEKEIPVNQPQFIGKPNIIIDNNIQLIYVNCMLNAWYAACREQLTAIKEDQTISAPPATASVVGKSLNFMKGFARTAVPSINHVVATFTVIIFNQDELVKLYNEIGYLLMVYNTECQRLQAKMLARVKTTHTADQAKWQGQDQSKIVVENIRSVDPQENLTELAKLTDSDTSTLSLSVESRGDSQQKVEVKKELVARREGVDKLSAGVISWEEVIDHLKTDNACDDRRMPSAQDLAVNFVKLQEITAQHSGALHEYNAQIKSLAAHIRGLNAEIDRLHLQIEDKRDTKKAAQAAAELQRKREVLRQCSPTLEQVTKMREDLKHFQDAAYYSKQQLESCKIDLKIVLLRHLKAEVLKLAEQCQLRGLHENAASRKIVSSARLPVK